MTERTIRLKIPLAVDFQDLLIEFVHLMMPPRSEVEERRKRRFADCVDFADEDEDGEWISDPSLSVSSTLSVLSAAHETDHIASEVLDPELPSMMSDISADIAARGELYSM